MWIGRYYIDGVSISSTAASKDHYSRTSISRPNSRSTDVPSRTENEHGRWRFPSLIWAEWILPRILAVPTPTAIPANLESTNLIILIRQLVHHIRIAQLNEAHPQASAHAGETDISA